MDDHDDRKALFSSLAHHFSNTRLSVSSENLTRFNERVREIHLAVARATVSPSADGAVVITGN